MSIRNAAHRFVRACIPVLGFLLCNVSPDVAGQTAFNTLATFESTDGNGPFAPLVQGSDQNFYGTTVAGGANGSGVVFRMDAAGTIQAVYDFCSQANCIDGAGPWSGLVQGPDGSFYGTTVYGGANDCGTVYKLAAKGSFTILASFDCDTSAGGYPYSGLLLGRDGNLYGSTSYGSTSGGAVFKLTPSGELAVIHNFCRFSDDCSDGLGGASVLVQDANGTLYGSTQTGGGPDNGGTVFRITPDGTETVLHSFCMDSDCSDGARPNAVILGSDGNIYGTTFGGGNDFAGTVFRISPAGVFDTLFLFSPQSLDGPAHPCNPYAGLLQGSDGNFYGTTYASNTGAGTIYSITASGVMTLLHDFSGADGEFPQTALIQAANGSFYGTAAMGGDVSCGGPPYFGCGTVFRLSAPSHIMKAPRR